MPPEESSAFYAHSSDTIPMDPVAESHLHRQNQQSIPQSNGLFGSNMRSQISQNAPAAPLISSSAAVLSFWQAPSWKRTLVLALVLSFFALALVLNFHRGAQRIAQFWSAATPLIAEYKLLQLSGKLWLPSDRYQAKLNQFRRKTAPKVAQLAMDMGGIYVKIGQVVSTMAVGILPDEYVQALRPLQDGIPPRPMKDIRYIIEQSTGQKLEDIFESIEEKPIGAASIAQAHKAVLKRNNNNNKNDQDNDTVIVKVQYPEVAELFEADLNNLELVVRLLDPGNMDVMRTIRQRHEKELDFRLEADHLRECRTNLQHHGVEPRLVRIPMVRNETGLCTQHVLVMEYLEGTSLHKAIEQEQDRMARALGKKDSQELRELLLEKIGEHLEQTHAANATTATISDFKNNHLNDPFDFTTIDRDHAPEPKWWHGLVLGPVGARIFRTYASVKDQVYNVRHNLLGSLLHPFNNERGKQRRQRPIQLGKVLKTLIHVHGLQMLRDGVYNADPHPGNILVLPDGRLGLLDYGMVGRITPHERKLMAGTIVALHEKDKTKVHSLYQNNGYRATWGGASSLTRTKDIFDEPNIVHRFATFHFDKFDLSPIHLSNSSSGGGGGGGNNNKRPTPIMDILQTTRERSVPNWIENGRRLSGLLVGVSLQAAHPMSMVKEWYSLAKDVLAEDGDDADAEEVMKEEMISDTNR